LYLLYLRIHDKILNGKFIIYINFPDDVFIECGSMCNLCYELRLTNQLFSWTSNETCVTIFALWYCLIALNYKISGFCHNFNLILEGFFDCRNKIQCRDYFCIIIIKATYIFAPVTNTERIYNKTQANILLGLLTFMFITLIWLLLEDIMQ
jgi:hypothetical protein